MIFNSVDFILFPVVYLLYLGFDHKTKHTSPDSQLFFMAIGIMIPIASCFVYMVIDYYASLGIGLIVKIRKAKVLPLPQIFFPTWAY